MAAMAMASFPFANIFSGSCVSTIPPYSNGDIRADFPTECTSGALPIRIPNYIEISLAIDFFTNLN
jgi:hypothetical protein